MLAIPYTGVGWFKQFIFESRFSVCSNVVPKIHTGSSLLTLFNKRKNSVPNADRAMKT